MMKRFRPAFLSCMLVLVPCLCAANSGLSVISPVEGVWANKQALVLDVPDSCEVFYSFTGSDPLSFGFAYDGPVLIDADGSVPLRIAVVAEDGAVEQRKIPYTVRRPDVSWRLPFDETQPLLVYSPGDTVPIPEGFLYCLGESAAPGIPGRSLTVEGGAFPGRYVPCTVTDGVFSWRFVIATDGTVSGASSGGPLAADAPGDAAVGESVPPFIVSDWDYITFNRQKLIYCIDDGLWAEASGSVFVDRSVPHTVYWQSVAYEPGNPVYSFFLPPKPQLDVPEEGSSPVVLEPGGGYTISVRDSGLGPVDSLCVDAFFGEELSAEFCLDVFYEGLYQGGVPVSVAIDKKPPARPVAVSSSDMFYNRSPVSVDFLSDGGSELFYSVSPLAEKAAGFSELELAIGGSAGLLSAREFKRYDGSPVLLDSSNGNAVLYSVLAYSRDVHGNESAPAEYRAIIDPYNYYVSSSGSSSADSDGSLARPFSSLEAALEATGPDGFKRIHLDGMLPVSSDIVMPPRCELHGIGVGSGLRVTGGASVIVPAGAQVAFTNCVMELSPGGADKSSSPAFFSISNASADFVGCEIVASFGESGSVFAADSSSVTLDDCGVTVRSERYASLFSGVRTNLEVTGGRYTAVAPTAVIFSLSAGVFSLAGSDCRVFANLGRVAELSGVSASVVDNEFSAELQGDSAAAARVSPLWCDGRSKLTSNSGNSVTGFPGGSN